jgi:tetratricopeptide (TPR) repeat protein
LLAALSLLAACSTQQEMTLTVEELGTVSFPNSGMKEAQQPFLRGVMLLHVFRYEEAALSFRRAQAADPSFALAYWGEAMTYHRPLLDERLRRPALQALSRLAATPEERRARAASERERDWLYAAEMLFGPEEPLAGEEAYREAMKALSEKYPEDTEARVFRALARLGPSGNAVEAAADVAAALEPVLAEHPDHPGAWHYLALAYARPGLGGRGLAHARAYALTNPEAPSPLHAISTILLANGAWDEAVATAEPALRLHDEQLRDVGRAEAFCDPYVAALQYAYLMSGRTADAEALLERCQEHVQGGRSRPSEAAYYLAMRARQVLDTGDWASAGERWVADVGQAAWARVPYDFVTAYAALRSGDHGRAAAFLRPLERLGASGDVPPQDRLLIEMLDAALLFDEERGEDAEARLRQIIAAEDELDGDAYAPATLLPARELLAEALIGQGRAAEATTLLQEALVRTPGRTPVRAALARAATSRVAPAPSDVPPAAP